MQNKDSNNHQMRKPKSIRQIRKLNKKSTRLTQEWKKTLLIRGNKTSDSIVGFMKDIKSLKKDKSLMYGRKHNQAHPFQKPDFVQKYCQSTDSSLFMFVSHNKKRPNNLVIGRMYEKKILDMAELGLINYEALSTIAQSQIPANAHPFVVFQGDLWQTQDQFKKLRNLLNDFFYMNEKIKGVNIDKVLSVLINFTVLDNRQIFMRTYRVEMTGPDILQEDGKMVIQELGPHARFTLRRTKQPQDQIWKKATYIPKPLKKKQDKNVKFDGIGNKRGKVYIDHQNFGALPTKKKLIKKDKNTLKGIIGVKRSKNQTNDVQLKEKVENQFAN